MTGESIKAYLDAGLATQILVFLTIVTICAFLILRMVIPIARKQSESLAMLTALMTQMDDSIKQSNLTLEAVHEELRAMREVLRVVEQHTEELLKRTGGIRQLGLGEHIKRFLFGG